MESSATPIPAEATSAAKKKAEIAAKKKAEKAAKKKAEIAAKKVVIGFAKERAKIELAGWITVSEVAKMLRITPRRVRDFLLKGRLPAMRVGRTWLIQRKDVLNFSQMERQPGRPVENEKKK